MSEASPTNVSRRTRIFSIACAMIAAGVLLHLPMLAEAHRMGNRLAGMGSDAFESAYGWRSLSLQGFQAGALAGFIPTLDGAAVSLLVPTISAMALLAWTGRETKGRTLAALEAVA